MHVEEVMNKSDIKQLQRALRESTGLTIAIDGAMGPQTEKALLVFRFNHKVDEVGAYALLKQYADLRYVSDDAFDEAAKMLGVPQSYVRAIAEVETNGESFLPDGRVKILFERHWFIRKLQEALKKSPEVRTHVAGKVGFTKLKESNAGDMILAMVTAKNSDICSTARGGYKGGEAEWDRLNRAMDFDIEAACQSASYGGYQLMGFNHAYCGYPNAKTMMLAMAASESKQFLAMISFIKGNPHLHKALKAGNWAKFAEGYNGSAYKENKYDTKLANAEAKHRKAEATA